MDISDSTLETRIWTEFVIVVLKKLPSCFSVRIFLKLAIYTSEFDYGFIELHK